MLYNNRATDKKTPRPQCDMCHDDPETPAEPAAVDGKTNFGPWAYMCIDHHIRHGLGLGLGVGQVLLCGDDLDAQLIEHYFVNESARGGGSQETSFGESNQRLIDDGTVEF